MKRSTKTHWLTKSKLLSYRQCPKRLWLEVNRPDLAEISDATQQVFDQGHRVGEIARQIYGEGTLIEFGDRPGFSLDATAEALASGSKRPIYEATFVTDEVMVKADVLKPTARGDRVIEVKSSTAVKDVNREDCAIQAWAIEGAGRKIESFHLAHINRTFVYQGDGRYEGLLTEVTMKADIGKLVKEVPTWVSGAKAVLNDTEPMIAPGPHCTSPYECGFIAYCHPPQSEYPIDCLPNVRGLAAVLAAEGIDDIRQIPAGRLTNPKQERVRQLTCSGETFLDKEAQKFVRSLGFPRYYLDFETISFAVPIWAGTRPYQALPFQWSCHIETKNGKLQHEAFLDLSGHPPMRWAIEKLLDVVGSAGPIITYSAYEKTTLNAAAEMFPDLAKRIGRVIDRLVDVLPVMRGHYYHPAMKGSWSIKAVLPTIAPDLDYATLEDVKDGGGAQQAFLEAIDPSCSDARRAQLKKALEIYCERDTLAMVRVVRFLGAGGSVKAASKK